MDQFFNSIFMTLYCFKKYLELKMSDFVVLGTK